MKGKFHICNFGLAEQAVVFFFSNELYLFVRTVETTAGYYRRNGDC